MGVLSKDKMKLNLYLCFCISVLQIKRKLQTILFQELSFLAVVVFVFTFDANYLSLYSIENSWMHADQIYLLKYNLQFILKA